MLFLVSLAILEDKIYKTKGHDCEHHIAFWMFLEGLNRELATFKLEINTTDHWSMPLATETETTTILDWVVFETISLLGY